MSNLDSEAVKTLDIIFVNTTGANPNEGEIARYDNALIIENGVMRSEPVTVRGGVLPTAAGMFGPLSPVGGRYTATADANGVVTSVTPNRETRKAVSVNVADGGKLRLGVFGNACNYEFAPDARVYVYKTTGGGLFGMGGAPVSVTVLESGMTVGQYIARVQSSPDSFKPNDEISIYLDSQGKVRELLVAEVDMPAFGVAATADRSFDLFTSKTLTDAQLIEAGIPAEYDNMDTIRSIDAGVYDPVKHGADAAKSYPMIVFLHGMGGGGTESGPLSTPAAFVKPAFQADFPDGAAYVVAARANEHLSGGPTWLHGPGGFGYSAIGAGGGMFGPRGPGAGPGGSPGEGMADFGNGGAVYSPVLVQLIKDVLAAYPNADPDRIYLSGFSAGGSMTQRLLHYTETGDRGIKFAAAAPLGSPMNLNDEQFAAIKNVPIWMMVGLYDSAAYSAATPAAYNAVKGFAVEGKDNARVTVFETIINPQGVTVHQHMVPTGVENNMIFDGNVPTNFTVFEGGGDMGAMGGMMVNGHPCHVTVGTPPQLDGLHMQWYGTIFDESDPRYKFGANPASNHSNEGTFVSWLSRWSLGNP